MITPSLGLVISSFSLKRTRLSIWSFGGCLESRRRFASIESWRRLRCLLSPPVSSIVHDYVTSGEILSLFLDAQDSIERLRKFPTYLITCYPVSVHLSLAKELSGIHTVCRFYQHATPINRLVVTWSLSDLPPPNISFNFPSCLPSCELRRMKDEQPGYRTYITVLFCSLGQVCVVLSQPRLPDLPISHPFDAHHWCYHSYLRTTPLTPTRRFKVEVPTLSWARGSTCGMAVPDARGPPPPTPPTRNFKAPSPPNDVVRLSTHISTLFRLSDGCYTF